VLSRLADHEPCRFQEFLRHAPWDMLAKSALLSQRLRLPTICLAFVLLPGGFHSQGGQLRLEAAGAPTQQLWFRTGRTREEA